MTSPGSCRCPDPPLRGDLCYCEETTLLLRLLPRSSCPGLQGNYCASLRRNSFVPLPSGILYLVLLHTLFRFLVRGTDLGPRAEQGVPPVPRGSSWRCSSIWTSRLCSGCAAMVASAVPSEQQRRQGEVHRKLPPAAALFVRRWQPNHHRAQEVPKIRRYMRPSLSKWVSRRRKPQV